ncbi:MAG: RNA-binding S4 domain-containing protein [Candidatus Omnitrophota bacterium]|jgi:ribosome-associated protein
MDSFDLTSEYLELFKILKIMGLSESGGMAKHAIESGLVKVDGIIETRKAAKIRPGQRIEYNAAVILVKRAPDKDNP